ncbi:hypothetical protein CPB83DRAFT_846074 [Crepidotus variabilis]|uniref:DUF6533 domain-containing protein n=1 Tax=Crepidotus variabilis TaxID=179855 RepID=A0A9P6ENT7_9AGAR|nr:hypothetical protein CPB83DRAFT_846074 [Crepidotus variabilis]
MSNMALNYTMSNPLAPEAWVFSNPMTLKIFVSGAFGILSVLIWDILSSLPEEFALIFGRRFSFPTFFYCLARFSPVFFMSAHNIILTQKVGNCVGWVLSLNVFYTCTHTASGMLFLLRLRAVYAELPTLKWAFSGLWVIHAASCTLSFIAVHGLLVEPVDQCIPILQRPYWIIMFFIQAGYELTVCVAVTYKLCADTATEPEPLSFWWLLRRRKIPMSRLKARFLADSQAYFVCVFLIKTIIIIACFVGNDAVQLNCGLLDNVLISLIATRVHRRLRLGRRGLLAGNTTFTVNMATLTAPNFRAPTIEEQRSSQELSNGSVRHNYPPQGTQSNK